MKSRITYNRVNASLYLRLFTFFAFVSLIMSVILFAEHYSDEEQSFCDLNDMFSCTRLRHSAWSFVLKTPVALLGVVWNVIAIIGGMYAMKSNRDKRPAQANYFTSFSFFWSLVGCVFIVYLFVGELNVGAFCPLCTVVHVATLIMTYLTYKLYRQEPALVYSEAYEELKYLLLLALVLFAAPVIRYNIHTEAADPLLTQVFPVQTANAGANKPMDNEDKRNAEPSDIVYVDTIAEVAKCLKERGWTFFGLDNCHHCHYQKSIFGEEGMKQIKFVECRRQPLFCQKHEISGFPSWILKDPTPGGKELNRIVGVQLPNYLASISTPVCPQSTQKIDVEPLH